MRRLLLLGAATLPLLLLNSACEARANTTMPMPLRANAFMGGMTIDWMYPMLNGVPNYAGACILDAGAGAPVDNTTTSWDGGCGMTPNTCYELQCPTATYVEAVAASSLLDWKSEKIAANAFWTRCFAALPTIAIDPTTGTEQCTLWPLTNN